MYLAGLAPRSAFGLFFCSRAGGALASLVRFCYQRLQPSADYSPCASGRVGVLLEPTLRLLFLLPLRWAAFLLRRHSFRGLLF